jgi:hypothetical protein
MKLIFKIVAPLLLALASGYAFNASSAIQEAPAQSADASQIVDRIVVVKSARTMTLEGKGKVLKTYKVALGGEPIGAKERQGRS